MPLNNPRKAEQEDDLNFWQLDFQKIYLGIKRHYLALILTSCFFAFLSLIIVWLRLTSFTATSILYYEEDLPTRLPGGYTLSHPGYFTVVDMITLPSNIQAVKSILGLGQTEEELLQMLDVPVTGRRSDLIRIEAKGRDPLFLVDFVNTLARVVVRNSRSLYQGQLQAALDNYNQQLEAIRQRLAQQNREIETFQQSSPLFELGAVGGDLLSEITKTRRELESATLQYNRELVEYENLRREIDNLPLVRGGRTATPLEQRITALEAQLAAARARYTPENPRVRNLELEIEELKREIGSGVGDVDDFVFGQRTFGTGLEVELLRMQGRVRSSQRLRQDLEERLRRLESGLEGFGQYQIIFNRLTQEKARLEQQIEFLSEAIETAQLLFNIPKASVEVYQFAEEARGYENKLRLAFIPLMFLLLGLFLGVTLAIIMELRDSKIRTANQIETAYQLKTLATIPLIEGMTRENQSRFFLFYTRQLAESIEKLSERMQLSKPIAITFLSARSNEGKSTLCFELASYFHSLSKRVLLLNFDYRPSVYTDDRERGVSIERFLSQDLTFDELIQHDGFDQASIGSFDPHLKELLKSEKMRELFSKLKEKYDLIFVDSPAILEDDYGVNLAAMTDLNLIVYDSSHTLKKELDACLQALNHYEIFPCGIVLNKVLPIFVSDERIKMEMKYQKQAIKTV